MGLALAHTRSAPALSANRDKNFKSPVNIAKSGIRKLQFVPLNFAAVTFKGVTSLSKRAKYSNLCVFLTDLESDTQWGVITGTC